MRTRSLVSKQGHKDVEILTVRIPTALNKRFTLTCAKLDVLKGDVLYKYIEEFVKANE